MTTSVQYALIRTIQVRNENVPGVLGALATAIGVAGANIGNLQTAYLSQLHVVRDIDVQVRDEAHLRAVLDAINAVEGVEVVDTRDDVLDLHLGGKIEMVSRYPVDSIATLRKVYTPGVAEVCRLLAQYPERRRQYTGIANTVAVVTDGTAVLGLGNVGLPAAMPVMEGKAALLHQFSGVSGVPILLDAHTVDEFVDTVVRIAPTFGGIHIEDVASPHCFDVVTRLQERLDIPVMQDDQDGTAAVVIGAVLAASRATGRELSTLRLGQIGLGAAGTAIAKLLMELTQQPVIGADRSEEALDRFRAQGGRPASLEDVMGQADVVITTTGVSGLIDPSLVRQGQIILALSNPDPEILPSVALEAGAALAADGSGVNNLLGYPGIWKGALRTRATEINPAMLLAAGNALAGIVTRGDLSPNPLDLEVHRRVAYAVGKAAVDTGVGQISGLEELE